MIDTILFWGLAVVAIAAALAVIILRKPADSVMALLASMAAIAGLFTLMGAYLVALFQIMIYIGAILVLFVFVVMILNIRGTDSLRTPKPRLFITGGMGIVLTAGIAWISWRVLTVSGLFSRGANGLHSQPSVNEIATALFTRHILVFELTSVLLFAAAVGAVYLTRKEKNRP